MLTLPSLGDDYEIDTDEHRTIEAFEQAFSAIPNNLTLPHLTVYRDTRSSHNYVVREATRADLPLIAVAGTIMVCYVAVAVGKFNKRETRGTLGLLGVLCVAFGILSGFGYAMWFGIIFTDLSIAVPFLVLGVGVDDIFVIINCLDMVREDLSIPERMRLAMMDAGPAITMTRSHSHPHLLLSFLTLFAL